MTVTQWWAVIIPSGKIFMGLIFVVEGTHENFNTTKISAYTVMTAPFVVFYHVT